jgi:formate hydrogenlyase subunit 6/NADH:ubiquinone oxidoreductase subunit I
MADGKRGEERDISRRELFKMVVPGRSLLAHARVELDRELCSACALCARDCPTGAIVASGDDGVRLTFRSSLCDACGVCLEACPEKCLRLEQDDKAADGAVLLFQDGFARCERCGSIIGSRAMIQRVRSKLLTSDAALASKIQLCPVCKARSS